jgi:signal transduction histidine kinase
MKANEPERVVFIASPSVLRYGAGKPKFSSLLISEACSGADVERGPSPLKEETREDLYRKELTAILRSATLINSSLDIEDVLDRAMKWAEEFMDAEASSVYQLHEKTQELFVMLARGEKREPVRKITLKVGEGIAGHVVHTGKPMVIQDVSKEERFSDKFDRITGFKTRSILCVPLMLRNAPIGALQVINKKTGGPFNRADLELLYAIAQHVAIAMENANLYKRLEKSHDMTTQELRITQQKLIRSERLAAMGNLVQGVAHEIRNPIMTIGGFAQRIKKEVEGHEKVEKYIDIIVEETNRLENLVRRIREFAEVQVCLLSPERPDTVLLEALRQVKDVAENQGVKIVSEIPSDLPKMRIDANQLLTALNNLLENALEAMPGGGTLALKSKVTNDQLIIVVEDTGCGIPKENLSAVYDPFVTSKIKGAGLGLTLVHQVVMNHHGELNLNSEKDRGTVVTIRLPLETP